MSPRMGIWGTLAGVALAGLAGSTHAQTPPAARTAPAPSKPAAVVNGDPITVVDIENVIKQIGLPPVEMSETQRKQLRMHTLALLIDDLLLQQYLHKSMPPVDPAVVAKKQAELEEALKKQGKTLLDFFKETNQNEAQLRKDIATQTRWLSYVEPRLSEAELKRFFEEYRDHFDFVTVRVSHIALRLPAEATAEERQAARTKLVALRQQILAGLDFAEAARKYSHCDSVKQGGDFGHIQRKYMVDEPFARAAFALKVGEVSDVVQTDYGLHLIKATERNPGKPAEYEKIKNEVREVYVEDLRQHLLSELRKKAKVEVHLQ